MTTEAGKIGRALAAVLLFVDVLLVAWCWFARPERAAFWALALLVIGSMAIALRSARSFSDRSIGTTVVFGATMIALPLAASLLGSFGIATIDLSRRGLMILTGLFLTATGNSIPKVITPLSALRCDPARAQAIQRFTGWTWVLTGLALVVAWLVLPVDAARVATLVVVPSGILLTLAQVVRVRLARHERA